MIKDGLALLVRLATGVQGLWLNCEPDSPARRVYIANHSSHLDFLVLWAAMSSSGRARTRPVAARDYWEASALRRFLAMRVFHAVLITRKGATPGTNVLRPLLDGLEEGASLILFPEGTRGTGESVQPFKSGIYHLCRMMPEVELVPAYLDNLNRVLPKGEFVAVPLLARVVFGPPLRLNAGETKAAFLERAHKAVCDLRNA